MLCVSKQKLASERDTGIKPLTVNSSRNKHYNEDLGHKYQPIISIKSGRSLKVALYGETFVSL